MRRSLLLVLLGAPLALGATVAVPIGAAQEPKPSIEQLVGRVIELRKQRADLKKQEDAAVADLKAELKRLQELLAELDLPDVKPPVPPKPPADPLAAKLKAAFDADPPADPETKREYAKLLAALYRAAEELARDETVSTSGELLAQVSTAAAGLLKDPPGMKKLAGTRKVVNAELAALLPTDDTLTADQRAATAALFKKLAAILDTIGG